MRRFPCTVLVLLATSAFVSAARAQTAPAPISAGFTIAADLHNAAYRMEGAPSVVVHAPPGFEPHGKLNLVVYLHGYSGCVAVLTGHGPSRCKPDAPLQPGWDLLARHDDAETNTLFIVPQLAFMKKSGRPGAFAKPGVFRAFLEELLSQTLAAQLGGPRSLRDVASVTLFAHSAGFETALAVLEHGEVSELVHNVILFDALYSGTEGYARYVLAHAPHGLRFVALHLGYGATYANDKLLFKQLTKRLGASRVAWADPSTLDAQLRSHAIVIGEGLPPHRLVPEHHLAQILRALDLPARPAAVN